MTRPVCFLTDEGVTLAVQIRVVQRRPVLADGQGWPLADAPGPHAHQQATFHRIHYRAVREESQP